MANNINSIPTKSKTYLSQRILFWLVFAISGLVFLHLIFQFLNLSVYNELNGKIFELSNRFDLDDESSVGTWLSQVMFICIAISSYIAGYLNKKTPAKKLWYLIAFIAIVFSIDEVASLHEFALQSAHLLFFQENAPTFLSNAWWIFAPIILFVSFWISYQVFKFLPRRTLKLFITGGFLVLFGAIFVDAYGSSLPKNSYTSQGIVVAIEESLELLGTATVLYAVVAYIELNYATTIKKSLRELKDN